MKIKLTLEIDYDPVVTDPEELANAMDRLLETALSSPGILQEYGHPKVGEFFVCDTPVDAMCRYVLYDFDMDELATAQRFATYEEAAEAADLLDNVIVVPLTVPVAGMNQA